MVRFLRLFAAFRNLESQLSESGSRRIALEDQVRHLVGENATLRSENTELRMATLKAKDEVIEAYKKLHTRPEAPPVHARGMQARALQLEATRKFYEDELTRVQDN